MFHGVSVVPGHTESSSGLSTTTSTAATPVARIPQDNLLISIPAAEINAKSSEKVSRLLTVLKGSPARDNPIADASTPTSTPAANDEDTTFDCYSIYGDDCFLVPDSIGPRLSAKLLKILAQS
ncbi:uncharacterized protein LOC111080353 [Drosophila obscura]|uniref:uncharacterized protein LOC111080353 n=1 Tax=Drosophila obscura TaxID=7282 RepID=UPI001BB1C206|nr:uncharacterized protein LOC111080353 [Drosophila obscura]